MLLKIELYNVLKAIYPTKKNNIVNNKKELHIEISHAEFLKDLF